MRTVAQRRPVFTTNEQYLEACHDLAEQKRQLLASLLATEADPEDKCVTASVLVQTWGVELDELWARRLAATEGTVAP